MTRTQWVFLRACGCAFGVLDGGCASVEYDAWKEFYERARDIRAAQARGVTVVHVPHERYVGEFMPQLRGDHRCPHGASS